MNTIRDYVNQIFKTVPLTEETNQLRLDILANMEDKYNELRSGGASEHEAVGMVIAEFGNIEELLEEMGINNEASDKRHVQPAIEEEAIDHFIYSKGKMGIRIGTGILSILAGVAFLFIFLSVSSIVPAATIIGIILLLGALVVGIGLLVTEGMRSNDLKAYHKPFVLLPDSQERIEEEKESYKKSLTLSIVLGVAFCIFAFAPFMIGMLTPALPSLTGLGIMLLFFGVGVLFFVYSGNLYHAYDVLLNNGKNPDTFIEEVQADKRRQKVDYIIDEIYWPIIVVIYFISSFLLGGWAWTWLIFVIGGVLEDTIKALLTTWD